ncbi:uncharacterized protein FIBRA_03451 [Fibroporia radiculosa]|uniref:DH domain-containing protein n=1 Tax=Fibroporia radiculosa TaxID=599839 RepID=J4GNH5_9APHY|nr:uncharacterized protein FIBRA_03451 [Fibroporia radiculosa]CCM01400.1 predicted protein [Fibroporia radiculosa]
MANRPRPHPHLQIPPGAAPPTEPSPTSSWSSYLYKSPPYNVSNIWSDRASNKYSSSASSIAPRISINEHSRPPSRASSSYEQDTGHLVFPEPQLYRSVSQNPSPRPYPTQAHRATRSELTVSPIHATGESRPPSFISTGSSPDLSSRELSDELSSLTLESEEGLLRFQTGDLPESDCEWYRLVPPEAREVLDKGEVQRQSILFEIIKSERDYVSDLVLVKEIFVDPLFNTSPVPHHRLEGFVSEVFNNLDKIQAHHAQMRDALFARQRDQHPLVQSIADVILASILDSRQLFRTEYEKYIKHYPLARAHHLAELKRNSKYQYFIQQCMLDPRMRKRDLITLLSRPVTRLPRLRLQLQTALGRTAPDHPDIDELPMILDILSDLVKSTQPGIEVSEGKVSFWDLCESLVYQRGEIIDLDLYDESRTLVHSGPLARRYRSDMGYNWADLHVALLDNYLLLLKPEDRSGTIRHSVVSRPIPLEYLRLAAFDSAPEHRKEKTEEGGFLDSFRARLVPVYPFTVYHASAKMTRRYTLYADSENLRKKWYDKLQDAIGVRKVQQEANMWFAPQVMNNGFFKYSTSMIHSNGSYPGKITAAIHVLFPFLSPVSSNKKLLAVCSSSGVWVAAPGDAEYRRVLNLPNPTSIIALPDCNKILVLSDDGLCVYSLDMFARAGLGTSTQLHLEATMQRIAGQDSTVLYFRAGRINNRTMILYVSKGLLQAYFHALEVVRTDDTVLSPRRSTYGSVSAFSFRPFGEPLAIPKDAHDITSLHRNIGICMDKGIWILDPTNPNVSSATPTIIPKFTGAESNPPMATLKTRCASAKPLGLIRCENEEILIVYDELGCYVNKHGVPCRSSGYLRWESKVTAFMHRGEHILLFSSEFIEVRAVDTGRLVQVIEGEDVRLVSRGLLPTDSTTLAVMKAHEERNAAADKIVELVETAELTTPRVANVPALWEDWGM